MQLEPKAEDQWLTHRIETAFSQESQNCNVPLKIGLAVSGGGDSIAMLHLLATQANRSDQFFVATVDHGLRPEAQEEAAFVAQTCAAYNLPHEILHWENWDGQGNMQAQARTARYALLADWGARNWLDIIALGHTQDDVAETFLMRLARGSGLDGLAAMEDRFDRHGTRFVRPLLSVERDMLRRYLTRRGHTWHDDPSNEDPRFQRVTARKVLGQLAPLGIGVNEISNAASELQLAKSALRHSVRKHAEIIVEFQGGDIVITWKAWAITHVEVQRRLLNAMLQFVGGTNFPPRADAVTDLEAKLHEPGSHTLNGCLVSASSQELRVAREFNAVKRTETTANELWDARWKMKGDNNTGATVRALGEDGLDQCENWRETGLPRRSLLASPSLWKGRELVAAPLAGLPNGWCATLTRSREQFLSELLSH
ncbi:MAG: tRNA lysidine(34) synthetase TilS [Pseudomonadota bacterium]